MVDLVKNPAVVNEANYADMWIEHTPVFKVVVGFTDQSDRKGLLEQIDPKIRRYVQFRTVKFKPSEIERRLQAYGQLFEQAGIEVTGRFIPKNQKFEITLASEAQRNAAQALIPASERADVQFTVGKMPSTEQTEPTRVQAGDWVTGGYTIHHSKPEWTEGSPWCTVGYTVTYGTNKKALVTAGHCERPLYLYTQGHYVTLGDPIVSKTQSFSGIYDYALYDITGIQTSNGVHYRNYEAIPEFSGEWLYVTGYYARTTTSAGWTVCKSGYTTGITCGIIQTTYSLKSGVTGYVEVADSGQHRLSAGGDSGGPWFAYPGRSTSIIAVGIHTAGIKGGCTDKACIAWYMPIERIWAHNSSVRLITQ